MAHINLTLSNAAAVTFLRKDGMISDPIIIPAGSIVGLRLPERWHEIVFPLGMERVITWTGEWALNGKPCTEPAWRKP